MVTGSPCGRCELLLDAIPPSVILPAHDGMLQAYLSWKCGTEALRGDGGRADGARAGPSTVPSLAEREDFSAQVLALRMLNVNAPGNGPGSAVPAPHCPINGWFRFVASTCLPSNQLLLGIPSSVNFGWGTTSFWARFCSFVDVLIPVSSKQNNNKKGPSLVNVCAMPRKCKKLHKWWVLLTSELIC